MPCYLFTYHGHGTWLPDHPRGYVRRKVGVLAADEEMARHYRENLVGDVAYFDRTKQQVLINAAIEAFEYQAVRGHAVATESTHIHILVSWRTECSWELVRRRLRSSLTRQLNQACGKQVRERSHFEYLMQTYLPRHRGLKWREDVGVYT